MLYRSLRHLDLFESPDPRSTRLATQMAQGRFLSFLETAQRDRVRLVEDGYIAWLNPSDRQYLQPMPPDFSYQNPAVDYATIQQAIPQIVDYIFSAQAQPHEYLWGGTVPPSYDCSGLIQAAFASVGIWLPRDAYQQEAFVEPITLDRAQRGDLIFFGSAVKATHVGLYLGQGEYVHSSGKEHGHNGIAVSSLKGEDRVSQFYACIYRGMGRVWGSYQPDLNS
jgi:cell wall-associated NlpC family hydrolase